MKTTINEVADGIYRLSTYVPDIAPPAGFTFNQFLVLGDEPLMFHTGLRKMFGFNRDALSQIIAPDRLRWIAFGHFEADECGAMNEWLPIAPHAVPAHGQTGCMVSLNDFADRPPRVLEDGEVIDLGGGLAVPGLIEGHGHFITFYQFLREKDCIRPLKGDKLKELRRHGHRHRRESERCRSGRRGSRSPAARSRR
mgnify:CR=1 FL=1